MKNKFFYNKELTNAAPLGSILHPGIFKFRTNYVVHHQVFCLVKCSLFAVYVSCLEITQEQQVLQEIIDRLPLWYQKDDFKFAIDKISAFYFYKVQHFDHSTY